MSSLEITGGSIAILIDCWIPVNDQNKITHKELYANIIQTVPTIPNLAAVILASYDTNEFSVKNEYYNSSYKLFFEEQPFKHVKQLWNWSQESTGKDQTYSSILNKKWNCPQYAMTEPWQLELYINTVVPHVKNIFFLGKTWDRCIPTRPLGIQNIAKMIEFNHLPKDIKFFTLENCVLEGELEYGYEHNPDLNQDPNCVRIVDNLYQIKI